MPPLLRILDRAPAVAPRPESSMFMVRVASLFAARPFAVVMATVLVTAAAGVYARHLGRGSIETDFGKLRRRDTWKNGEGYWGKKMDALLGRYLTPIVILTDDPAEATKAAAALREAATRPPLDAIVSSVQSESDVLPSQQTEKLAIVEEIRGMLTPKIRSLLPPERLEQVDKLLGDKPMAPVRVEDLPSTFVAGMRERDGRVDRTVLVYPKPTDLMWQGETIVGVTRALRDAVKAAVPGNPPRVAGSIPVSADIISSIERDGPLATLAALGGVILLVVLLLRRSSATLYVIGSLCLGVLWLCGAIVALHVKINFANFIAFPITFGIGVDYSVNVMARYVADGERDITGAVASTGGAVGLCSLTTIIGYSSLLLAENQALFSFGLVAVLGEIACLTTAVVVLPAVILVLRRGRPAEGPAAG
jgi:hypothetical protein